LPAPCRKNLVLNVHRTGEKTVLKPSRKTLGAFRGLPRAQLRFCSGGLCGAKPQKKGAPLSEHPFCFATAFCCSWAFKEKADTSLRANARVAILCARVITRANLIIWAGVVIAHTAPRLAAAGVAFLCARVLTLADLPIRASVVITHAASIRAGASVALLCARIPYANLPHCASVVIAHTAACLAGAGVAICCAHLIAYANPPPEAAVVSAHAAPNPAGARVAKLCIFFTFANLSSRAAVVLPHAASRLAGAHLAGLSICRTLANVSTCAAVIIAHAATWLAYFWCVACVVHGFTHFACLGAATVLFTYGSACALKASLRRAVATEGSTAYCSGSFTFQRHQRLAGALGAAWVIRLACLPRVGAGEAAYGAPFRIQTSVDPNTSAVAGDQQCHGQTQSQCFPHLHKYSPSKKTVRALKHS